MEFDFSKEPGKSLLERELVNSEAPLVSIITPFYNSGKYFEQACNSILNQTFPWFEWIIIDNGSTDIDSLNLLESVKKKDSRIKVFYRETSSDDFTINKKILKTATDIIVPFNVSNILNPTFLEVTYWALSLNPKYSCVYTDFVVFQNKEYLCEKKININTLNKTDSLFPTVAICKKDFIEIGLYNFFGRTEYEEQKSWIQLLETGKKIIRVPIYGFWYRCRDEKKVEVIENNRKFRKKTQKKITEQVKKTSDDAELKEYPYATPLNTYAPIKFSNWDEKKSVFKKKRKTHIMLLIPWMEMGGADAFNLEVVKKIDKDKYEVSILTTVHGKQSWRQYFEEYVRDIFELPTFLNVENYPEFISYFIKSREVDIIFVTNSYYGYYIAPWLKMNFPKLVIVDYVHMEEWYWRSGGFARVSGALKNITEKTFVCNNKTREVLLNKFNRSPESVKTLYIGVDKDKYSAEKYKRGTIRKKMGIEESRPIVLFPCRIHPQKRPFLMLEIAKKLRGLIPNIAFLVVGDGEQLSEVQLKIKEEHLEQTVFLAGRQNKMQPYYRDSDITLICSLKEGLALTAYESCSMGVPVVTSDVGGQAELIDDSVGAVIPLMQKEKEDLDQRQFLDEEIDLYVNALRRILEDKEDYVHKCESCRKRVENNFSTDVMIDSLQKEFEYLMTNNICCEERQKRSKELCEYKGLITDRLTVYQEIENVEAMYHKNYSSDSKSELMRIASSKWGKRVIKLAFKLQLNKLFK